MAAVLTLIQTKQLRINVYKRNNTKNTVQIIQSTVNANIHITKTPTLLPKTPIVVTSCLHFPTKPSLPYPLELLEFNLNGHIIR